MTILNTDLLNEDDKEIQLDGKIYKIPADLPNKLHLQLIKINRTDDPVEKMEAGTEILIKIFKLKNSDFDEKEFLDKLTTNKYAAIINYIFADIDIEETIKILKESRESIKETLKDGKKKPSLVEN